VSVIAADAKAELTRPEKQVVRYDESFVAGLQAFVAAARECFPNPCSWN
jgi:hypothetical protein